MSLFGEILQCFFVFVKLYFHRIRVITLPIGSLSSVQFSREAGFWSNPRDKLKKDFFNALTESKSQREDWYRTFNATNKEL